MVDAEALWAAVRAANDDLPKLVLADYLEEKGDEATGYALRWCVAHDHWPHRIGDGPRGWAWGNGMSKHVPKPHTKGYVRAVLPSIFFVAHGRVTVGQYAVRLADSWRFGSDVEALVRLGEVLGEVRRVVGLTAEPKPVRKTPAPRRPSVRRPPTGPWRKAVACGIRRSRFAEYTFGSPATVAQLKAVESAIGGELPTTLRAMLSEFNGVRRPYEYAEGTSEKEIVYFDTGEMLKDVPDYLRNWGDPPVTPSGLDLRKVVFVGQVNGFADLYGVCRERVGKFRTGEIVKLDHETGELEKAFDSLEEYVEDGPK